MRHLAELRDVETRSISPENFDGRRAAAAGPPRAPGPTCARDLGQGWKVSPSVDIPAGATFDLATIDGAGEITHIWITTHTRQLAHAACCGPTGTAPTSRRSRCRSATSSASGWGGFAQVNSQLIAANPHGGFNSYWPMPFRDGARLTLENLSHRRRPRCTTRSPTRSAATTSATAATCTRSGGGAIRWRLARAHRSSTGVDGHGAATSAPTSPGASTAPAGGARARSSSTSTTTRSYPTICGTGTEDYFGGAWNFDVPGRGYTEFSTPYLGMPQVIRPDGLYVSHADMIERAALADGTTATW